MTLENPYLLVGAGIAAVRALLLVRGVALGYPAAMVEGSILSAKEQAIVKACGDAILPSGGLPAMSATEAGVIPYFDRMMRGIPAQTRFMIRLLVRLMEHGPWIFGMRARLTRQSVEDRIRTFEEWSVSPVYILRVGFMSMRTLLSMAYLANDEVARQIGAVPNAAPFEGRAA